MKKLNLLPLVLSALIELTGTQSNAQATFANNNTPFGAFLGWDLTVGVPLLIQHQGPNQPIRFLNFDNNVGAGIVTPKMELTIGGAMIDDLGVALPNDGLRIWNPGYVFKNFAS